ncbi:unnamed protein product [Phytophthora lilii]|uniref:Unnamed protein product n=1 Tax=Phytophthora lilii TaxID=2077276 RepID=A0A9W6WX23_9STRA|nr:unnamed protein product [Phytophthora lilii]
MPPSLLKLVVALAAFLVLAAQTSATQHTGERKLEAGTPLGWPALRFQFTIKRSSMSVFGQTDFSMYANPVVSGKNDKVLYDVYATFTQNNTLHNYTLVDGVSYFEDTPFSSGSGVVTPVSKCINSESGDLPPVNAIAAAVSEAKNVSSSAGHSSTANECWGGNTYTVTVNGIDFSLCASGQIGFTMKGNYMDISVYYLESQIDIQAPTMDAAAARHCPTVASPSVVSPIGHSLLTGEPVSAKGIRKLKSAFDFSLDGLSPSCSCKSKPRPCVFIHGQGLQPEMEENQDSFPHYWGNLTNHAPCCSSMKYARLDTITNSWTDDTQQEKVCNRALAVSSTSSMSTIADTIIVTHSMGNLMLAGALANGKCKLDASSTWVGLAGPMKGSMASDFVQDSCAGKTNAVLEKFGEITGKCPPKGAIKSLAYEGESYSSTKLDAAYLAAQNAYKENVYALMCGEGYSGVLSKYQAKFWVLGGMIPHKSELNDGMVEFQSCAVGFPESKFGDTYRDRFYRTKLNHFDMEFLAGDSLLNEAKMPVKWFECLFLGTEMKYSPRAIVTVLAVVLCVFKHALDVAAESEARAWPSLGFHFKLKRTSMKVYGKSEFSVYANPAMSTNNTDVLYDAVASFELNEVRHNYTLSDGRAYFSRGSMGNGNTEVTCLATESSILQLINQLVTALNDAVPVSSVPTSGSNSVNCSRGSLLKASVKDVNFAVCSSVSAGLTLQGTDMDVNVEYLTTPFNLQDVHTKMDCKKTVAPTSVTPIGKSLLTGQPTLSSGRQLKAAFDFSFEGLSSCSCKSTPRPCIFIHGMGVAEEMPENQDNFTDYWGDHLADHAPCSLEVSETSTESTIADTIVVTHSMGNLMFAGALANGKCKLGASSTWVGMAGPMKGSMASDFVQQSCAGETNDVWEKIGNITGRCPVTTALKSVAYEDGDHSSKSLNAAYRAAQRAYRTYVSALMCGSGYSGILSMYQAEFWALGTMVPHKSRKNDGMVEFDSCAVGFSESRFCDSWRDRFYKTSLNHYDMQFLSGDALLNGEKMPMKWFECLL